MIWTDVFQCLVMAAGMITVLTKVLYMLLGHLSVKCDPWYSLIKHMVFYLHGQISYIVKTLGKIVQAVSLCYFRVLFCLVDLGKFSDCLRKTADSF